MIQTPEGPGGRVLVAYASGRGAARAVAETVGRTLCAAGLRAEVRAAAEVTGVERYDAVILGSDLAPTGWLLDAAELLESFQEALTAKPLWLFSDGREASAAEAAVLELAADTIPADGLSAGHTPADRAPADELPADVAVLAETTAPEGITVFGGGSAEGAALLWASAIAARLRGGPNAPEAPL